MYLLSKDPLPQVSRSSGGSGRIASKKIHFQSHHKSSISNIIVCCGTERLFFRFCSKTVLLIIYCTCAIITRSWILIVDKVRILRKKLLKKNILAFKNGVKSIQTASYNGPRTVARFYLCVGFEKKGSNLPNKKVQGRIYLWVSSILLWCSLYPPPFIEYLSNFVS